MGVFELADEADNILFVGYAGGRSLFGLRGELASALRNSRATRYRYEVTTAYLTRYQELLMVYEADHGGLPPENDSTGVPTLGRLSPG